MIPDRVRSRFEKLQALAARPGTEGEGAAARAAIDRMLEHWPELRGAAPREPERPRRKRRRKGARVPRPTVDEPLRRNVVARMIGACWYSGGAFVEFVAPRAGRLGDVFFGPAQDHVWFDTDSVVGTVSLRSAKEDEGLYWAALPGQRVMKGDRVGVHLRGRRLANPGTVRLDVVVELVE